MKTNRPKIKVPYEPIDIIVDLTSIALLIALVIYTFMSYSDLPETIATHFDATGKPNGYSNKDTMWFLPAIGIVMFIGLFILNKYPHLHNYMVNITEDNALKNYRFSTRIVRFTNLFVCALFLYVQYTIVATAQGKTVVLGSWFVPLVIGLSVLLPIGILIYNRKLNK